MQKVLVSQTTIWETLKQRWQWMFNQLNVKDAYNPKDNKRN